MFKGYKAPPPHAPTKRKRNEDEEIIEQPSPYKKRNIDDGQGGFTSQKNEKGLTVLEMRARIIDYNKTHVIRGYANAPKKELKRMCREHGISLEREIGEE